MQYFIYQSEDRLDGIVQVSIGRLIIGHKRFKYTANITFNIYDISIYYISVIRVEV